MDGLQARFTIGPARVGPDKVQNPSVGFLIVFRAYRHFRHGLSVSRDAIAL